MDIPVTEKFNIPDGLHKGVVTSIEYRDEPYQYTDLIIHLKVNDKEVQLKAGYPTVITTETQLGKLLSRFGAKVDTAEFLNPDKILIGRKCQFQTVTESSKNGEFARILRDTVKPDA